MIFLVVDIDGTLADIEPRMSIAGKEPSRENLEQFQAWLDRVQTHETLAKDEPIQGMRNLLECVRAGAGYMVYLTGRSDKYRTVTTDWLEKHGFPVAPIRMRKDDDWRTAADFKCMELRELRSYIELPCIVIDDDAGGDCSDMYDAEGITHLKVMHKFNR